MGDPKLILRFRNYMTGVLGTEEHQKIIREFGRAWWGWWKRSDEPNQIQILSSLTTPFSATLISLAEEVQFSMRVEEIRIGSVPSIDRVPSYYRNRVDDIPVWFNVSEILDQQYDEELADRLKAHLPRTLVRPDELSSTHEGGALASCEIESEHNHLLHISDIHLGDGHNFSLPGAPKLSTPDPSLISKRTSIVESICKDLDRLKVPGVAAVVVSGDIVSRCNWQYDQVLRFFSELADRLRIDSKAVLLVPGNHDFYRQDEKPEDLPAIGYQHESHYRLFWAQFHGVKPFEEISRTARLSVEGQKLDVVFGLLNSARWASVPGFFEYGFVGKEKYSAVLDEMKQLVRRPTIRCLVLHHHLVPIQPLEQPGVSPSRPISVTLDATEILRDAQATDISLVLHGHQHRADVIKVSRLRFSGDKQQGVNGEDIFVCAAGSCGSGELPRYQRNTYTLLKVGRQKTNCRIRILDPEDNDYGDVVNIDLPTRTVHP